MKSLFRKFRPLIPLAVVVLVLLLPAGNGLIAKKVLAHLLMPSGLLWMALFAGAFWKRFGRSARAAFAGLWVLMSLAGSPYLGIALLGILEKPLYQFEEVGEPFDALVLLGGGTRLSPGGNPAVATHGDRVLKPASLFHEGKVKALIATGRSITEIGEDRLLGKETSQIWQSLRIPADVIHQLNEPRNTAEELAAVAELLKQHPEWKRVGLSSSASHLPRAMKEARKQGLDLVPVPGDFRTTPLQFSPVYLIPQGRGFRDVQSACWEFLGLLF